MSLLRRIEGSRPEKTPASSTGTGGPEDTPPAPQPVVASPLKDAMRDLRANLQNKIINNLDPRLDVKDERAVKSAIEEMFNKFLEEDGVTITRVERQRLLEQIYNEVLGFGPIQPLLEDDTVTEVMVNGPFRVYIERKGRSMLSDVSFTSDEHVMRTIERILAPIGRRVDEAKPLEDARLPDGSRVNVIIPPLSLNGPCITIRKFPKYRISPADYVKWGTAAEEKGPGDCSE